MPLDRGAARAVLTEALPADPKWGVWIDGILDRLEPCITPRLAEVDVRLVGEAEAKLARIRALCDEAASDEFGFTVDEEAGAERIAYDILDILDART